MNGAQRSSSLLTDGSKIQKACYYCEILRLRDQLFMAPWYGFHLFDKER